MLLSYEKRALFRFLSVYIGAIALTVFLFSYLFFEIEKEAYKDRIFHTLRAQAFEIASSAIDAQMHHKTFTIPSGIEYMLLDKKKRRIDGTFDEKIELAKDFFIKNGSAYYIDRGAKGHLGIEYIVVRKSHYDAFIKEILKRTIFIAIGAFSFLMLVGWYLANLFLEPMRERIKELDRFIKDSTHELNTPVTSLLLASKKLENSLESKYLKALQIASKQISKIYQDLLFLSFNRYQKEQKEQIDVAQIIQKNVDFFTLLSEQKGLKIKKELSPCYVVADRNHIDILIKNLIENAIKYSYPNKEISITLQECRFSITNFGKAIEKEKLSYIFKRYARDDESRGGFGIGLDIVSSLCKKYGYKVEVSSQHKRITFMIYFI